MVEEKKQSKDAYVLEEVLTPTSIVIKDSKSGEVLTFEQALVKILNKLDKIAGVVG